MSDTRIYGGVRLSMSTTIETVEMATWECDRIDRFFRGAALIQAAVRNEVPDFEVMVAEQHMALVRQLNGLPPFLDIPTYEQRVREWADSIPDPEPKEKA